MVGTNPQTTKTVEWLNITVNGALDGQQIVCANAGQVTLDAVPGGELLLGYITIKMENISSGEVLYYGTLSDFSSFTVDESNMIQYTLYLLSADNSCQNKNLTFVIKVAGLDADTVVISTADVSINMNDGRPILSQYDYDNWNGVAEQFFITNDSTVSVYARLYLDDVSGSLADSVTVSVCDYEDGTNFGAVWNKGAGGRLFAALPNALGIGQRKDLTVAFSVESGAHGEMQFTLACDIVQTTNNSEHIYDGKFTDSGSTASNIMHQRVYFEHFCKQQ